MPRTGVSTLTDLGSDAYRLAHPVAILTEDYGDHVIARYPEVEAFAEGATEAEAIAALKPQIVGLYEDLRDAVPSELGRLPLSWKALLAELVVVAPS